VGVEWKFCGFSGDGSKTGWVRVYKICGDRWGWVIMCVISISVQASRGQ